MRKYHTIVAIAAAVSVLTPMAHAETSLSLGDTVNGYLKISGANFRLESMTYYTSGEDPDQMGRTVFFSDRGNKQVAFAQFAPDDFNRMTWTNGDPNTIDWSYNTSFLTADVSPKDQKAAHYAAMETWDSVKCSEYGLSGGDVEQSGVILAIISGGAFGSFDPTADIMHNGFFSRGFFDFISPPNGGDFILGVSFSFVFEDIDGNIIDNNNDGYPDKAFGDNYYNDKFEWNIGSTYDIETVVLHEAGHGHGQAHFGEAFLSGGNNRLHFNPRAVMNATYSGVQTKIGKTDRAGHCAGWANWPNK